MYSSNRSTQTGHFTHSLKRNAWRISVLILTAFAFSFGVVTAVSAARLYAPIIAATKTDTFIGGDGDGKADPGETIQYTVVVNNSGVGATDATGVGYDDTIDSNTTLVGGSLSASPVGSDDTFPVTVLGNVSIDSAALASPFSVTTNDYLGLNPVATISAVEATTTVLSNTISALSDQGGNVVMTVSGANIGKFTYDPPPGYEGTDTFTYTLADNANATSAASNRQATVSITVSGMIWFVDRDNPSTCISAGCGRFSNPFTTLAAFNGLNDGAGNHPANADNIFIYESSSPYTGGVALRSGQKLIGQDATQTLSTITGLTSPTGSPALPAMNTGAPATVIQHSSDAVSVQTDVIPALIRGLSLDASAGNNAIDITLSNATSGTLEISENIIVGAGAEGIDINRNSTGTLTLDVHNNTWNTAGTHGNAANEHGFDARTTATGVLNLNFHNNNVIASNTSSSAVFVDGSGGGTITITNFASNSIHQNTAGTGITVNTATFDATPGTPFQQVSGGSTTIGTLGNGVGTSGMVLTTVSGDLDFTDLDIFNDAGTGLNVDGTGAIAAGTGFRLTSTGNVASVDSTGGPAVNIVNTTINLLFTSIESTNSSTSGVTLDNIDDGTSASVFSAGAGSSITNAGTTDFVIANNNADVTYAGTITDDVGQLVSVTGNNSGTKSFTGAINDGNDGDGSGISLTSNTGGTIRFSGGLLLSTGANPAFAATANTGTTLEVCDEAVCNPGATGALVNTITTAAGTALNVANTTIGANNLEFRSISSSGSSSTGIILDTTGSSGGLKVKGNGTAGSGGTIANKSGSDGSTSTGIGIYLRNTSNVFLDRMQLNDFQNFAIRGVGVSGFSLNNSVVNVSSFSTNGTTTGSDEASISFGDRTSVTGLTGTATITNTTIRDGYEDDLSIFNWNGTLDLTVNGSIIRNTGAVEGNDGVIIEAHGTANVSVDVRNSQFAANRGDHFQATADDSAILDVQFGTNGANTLTGGHTSPLGQSVVISSGGLSCTGFSGQVTFNISNNSINGAIDTPINVNKGGGTTASSFSGTINNNLIGTTGQANSGTTGNKDAIRAVMNGCGSYTAAITNNILKEVSGNGIFGIARDGDGAGGTNPGNLDLIITGNQLSLPNPGNNGIRVEAGATSTDDMDVCVDVGGAGGLANTVSGDWGAGIGADEIRLRHQFSTLNTFRLPGFGGGGVANVPPYLTGRNSGFPPSTASATVAGTGAYTGGAACASPIAMLPNRVVVQTQPDTGAKAQSDVILTAVQSITKPASGVMKLSKQATWAKASKVALLSSKLNSGNDQLISAKLPAPATSGENVNVPIGNLPATKSVKIVFRVTVNSPLPQNATKIINQGTVSSNELADLLTTNGGTSDCEVGSETCTPIDLVDLSVLKSNDTSNTVVLGNSFTWQVQVSNIAASRTAIFTSGQVVLEDHLPSSATYAAPVVVPTGGIIGTPNCSITSDVLTCTAPAGGLTIPSGEAFAVAFTTTPNTPGSLVNPTGGVCQVDPNTVFAENSIANNTCSNTVTVTRPTTTVVSITRQSANPNKNASVTWQIVFANAVDGLAIDGSNFTLVSGGAVTGAVITSVTETSGPPSTTWNISANTGTGDGTLELRFANDTGLSHEVTNAPYTQPSSGAVYTIDKTGPKVSSILRQPIAVANPTNADVLVFRVTFDEAVTGVGADSFVSTGTTTPISSSVSSVTANLVYDFTIDGIVDGGNLVNLNGTVGINVAGSPTITDLAGNTLQVVEPTPASNDQTYTLDNIAPTVTINQAAGQLDPTNTNPINFTVVFNEPVTDFDDLNDVTLSGTASATVTSITEIAPMDDTTYTVATTATTNGTVIATVPVNKAQDAAGNNNAASTSTDNSVTYDATAPTVTINQAAGQLDPTNANPINFTVVFSEAVTDFDDLSDVTLGGTASATVTSITEIAPLDGTTYTVAATATTDGTVIASVPVNKAQDLAGNNNAASTSTDNTVTYDTTAPTVTINQAAGQLDPTGSNPINFTVVFSEPVSDFDDLSDVTLSGGASATVTSITEITPLDGTTYTVAVTATSDGTVIATVPVNKAQDAAGNNNAASTSTDNSVLYDTVDPDVTINQAGGQLDPTSANPINFTAVFSEPVTDFDDLGDVTLSGTASATVTSITEIAPLNGTTYTVAVTATSNGTVIATIPINKAQDLAGRNNTASTSTDNSVTYVPPVDLSITKTDGVVTATPGGSVTYTITASNAGPNADPAATITDTFPASLSASWTCVGAGGGTCTAGPSAGNINDTVNLPVGGSVTYTVSATISASATGTLANTATVAASASVGDTNTANNSATDTDTLSPQADLAITKTDGVTTATPGGSVTYTITASNAGPSNAPSVTVADTFPASLTASWTCVGAGGGTCTAGPVAGNINDSVNLPAGASVTYTVSAAISPSATGTLANTATVSSSVTDPSPANNSATDTDTLTPTADLSITKTDGSTIAVAGNSLTYTIVASNAGPSNAPGSTVADTFSADLTGVTWTCVGAGGGTCTAGPTAGNINDVVNLPAGGSVTYTATGTVNIAATGTLSNTATVTAPGSVTDPVPGNNSATDNDTVVPPVAVTINQKTSAPAQVDPTNVSPINFTVIFASAVTDFDDAADVTLGGTAGATTVAITGGPSTYNVAVSGMTGAGTVTATIGAGVATGSQTEPNAASTSTDNSVFYDATAPDTTILTYPANPTNATSATFTFSGNDGTGVGGITFECKLDTGSFVLCSSGINYPGPLTQGSHTFQVRAIDSLGNTDATPASYTWTVDSVAPTGSMTSTATNPTNVSPIPVTVQFSETVSGFVQADITPTNGTINNFTMVDGDTYTFDLVPSIQGTISADIAAGSFADTGDLNFNTAPITFSRVYDSVVPTVTIDQKSSAPAQADPTSATPINFTVIFSEAVLGFGPADITLSGTANPTTAVISGTGPTYNVAVSGMTGNGTVIADVKKSGVTDAAGNLNDASTSTDNIVTYDGTPLTVAVNQAAGQADPTSVAPIHFTAVFSEGVTGFTKTDISYVGTTLSGSLWATITEIAPMDGTTYDLAINGMIPKGTVFVSIPAGGVNSITRPTATNQASTSTDNSVVFDYVLVEVGTTSTAGKDGWVLESTETSGVGGSLNSSATTLRVGDDATDRQYRSVVDFATGSLPNDAIIYAANLRIIQASITGTNPFTTHGALRTEIKSGFFGSAAALQNEDFESAPNKTACNFESVPEILESLGPAYRCVVLAAAFPYINLTGSTQLRLRFLTDDNNDNSADIFNFYSGNFSNPSQAPRLFIKYYLPPVEEP